MDVLLHHQCVSMVTQCLVMNTRPHNSAQIYVFDLDIISFSNLHFFFLSEKHLLYLCHSHTHSQRALTLFLSLSFSPSPPDWGRFEIRQLARPIKPLRTDEDKRTDGYTRTHSCPPKHTLNTHITHTCRQTQGWGGSHTFTRLQDNKTDI